MFTGPITGCGFIFCGLTVVSCSKICAAFWIFVFSKIAVVTMPIRNFFNFIPLFAKNYEFFLRPFGGAFGFVETSESLAHILDSPRRKTLKPFCRHNL